MELITDFINFFLHLDTHLDVLVTNYSSYAYIIIFLIIFCETGLVVAPILPGDSLLFATGAVIASTSNSPNPPLNSEIMLIILIFAAVLGDAVNYFIGSLLGEKAFKKYPKIFRPAYLEKTRAFYEKYGGMTIIYARFVPIVRTFAPFLAGVGNMSYRKFAIYNIIGACLWITLFLYAGVFFGTIPAVKENFTLVILGIIVVSIIPPAIEFFRARDTAKTIQ